MPKIKLMIIGFRIAICEKVVRENFMTGIVLAIILIRSENEISLYYDRLSIKKRD